MSKLNISGEELVRLRKLYKRRNELRAEFKIDFLYRITAGKKRSLKMRTRNGEIYSAEIGGESLRAVL